MLDVRDGKNRQNRIKVNIALQQLQGILADFNKILEKSEYLDFSTFLEKNLEKYLGSDKEVPINLVEVLLLKIINNLLKYKTIVITNSSVLVGKPTKKKKINIRIERRDRIHTVLSLKDKYFFDCTGGRLGNILTIHNDQFGNSQDLKSKYVSYGNYFETIDEERQIEELPPVAKLLEEAKKLEKKIPVETNSVIVQTTLNKIFKCNGEDTEFNEENLISTLKMVMYFIIIKNMK